MSASLYYSAVRAVPLTDEEKTTLRAIESRYSKSSLWQEIPEPKDLYNAEDLNLRFNEEIESAELLSGSAKFPSHCEAHLVFAITSWLEALTEMRKTASHSDWQV